MPDYVLSNSIIQLPRGSVNPNPMTPSSFSLFHLAHSALKGTLTITGGSHCTLFLGEPFGEAYPAI